MSRYQAIVDGIIEPGCYYADLDDLEYYRDLMLKALVEAHKQGLVEAARWCDGEADVYSMILNQEKSTALMRKCAAALRSIAKDVTP